MTRGNGNCGPSHNKKKWDAQDIGTPLYFNIYVVTFVFGGYP